MKNSMSMLLLLIATLGACAHREAPKKPHLSERNARGGGVHLDATSAIELPPHVTGENLPPLNDTDGLGVSDAVSAGADTRTPVFAVWIDSYGFDALAALGLLQELEKQGLKPVKIVGSGFGCWVAQSWAVANSGNQAEWTALKWNDWAALKRGLFNRLTGSGQEQFEEEVLRLSRIKSWSQYQLPCDCPLLTKNTPFKLVTGQDLAPESAFWASLQLPIFNVSNDRLSKTGYYSASLGGAPSSDELWDLSRDVRTSPEQRFAGWLVISTRSAIVSEGSVGAPMHILAGRSLVWPESLPALVGGDPRPKVLQLKLGSEAVRPASELTKAENRRRFLLEGRKKSSILIPKVKNFLE